MCSIAAAAFRPERASEQTHAEVDPAASVRASGAQRSLMASLELLLEREGDALHLSSPEVGWLTQALPPGALLAAGMKAGVLQSLGRRLELVVPTGVAGRIQNPRPHAVFHPLGYGARIYELAPLEAGREDRAAPIVEAPGAALVFHAPYAGRFWQRPAPNEPLFVRPGDALVEGQTIGLLEVMKTFTHLVYRATGGLPARARLVRFLAADGGEVKDGGGLLELELG